MDTRRNVQIGAALVWTVLLAACMAGTQDQPPVQSSALADTRWVLVSLNGSALIEGKEITLNFGETSIDGSAGCNTYGGDYAASGDGLRFGDVYWTEMACLEPEGIMEQEQAYFAAVNAAARYQLAHDGDAGDRLEVYDGEGAQTLVFVAAGERRAAQATNTPQPPAPTATALAAATPTHVPPTPDPPTATALPTATPTPNKLVQPTATPAVFEPPPGSKQVVDTASGISLWVPQSWTVVAPGPHGGPTILQSYPKEKYVGGEGRQPGDTKCDLTVHPPGTSVADVVPRNRSDPPVTVISEQEIVLRSGRPGTRFTVESMGRSLSLVTSLRATTGNERAVVLTCFGELEPFDEIAATLDGADIVEGTPSPAVEPAATLIATLQTQESLPTGAVVNVRFTLTNTSSEGLYVLKWFTPLEGLAGDIFRVQGDGVDLAYRGKLVKRGPPIAEDYVWIDAGGSVSAEVDLAQGYDLTQGGQYTLQFRSPRLSHTAQTLEQQASSFDELGMIRIPSDPVSVTIGKP